MISVIVVDIEGTASPTASVRALYDYTYRRLPEWLNSQGHKQGYARGVVTLTRGLSGQGDADVAEVTRILQGWLKADAKMEPLKLAQGLICAEGFRSGELRGEFFPDVIPALSVWRSNGMCLCVYSSGSIDNQQDWFGGHKDLINRWFDLTTGPKLNQTSYEAITAELGCPAGEILFLSDHSGELDAALEAGWRVLGVHREGEPNPVNPPHRWISSFTDVELQDLT